MPNPIFRLASVVEIAGELMKLVVKQARLNGLDKLHLYATDTGRGVYERVGFRPPRFASLELKL